MIHQTDNDMAWAMAGCCCRGSGGLGSGQIAPSIQNSLPTHPLHFHDPFFPCSHNNDTIHTRPLAAPPLSWPNSEPRSRRDSAWLIVVVVSVGQSVSQSSASALGPSFELLSFSFSFSRPHFPGFPCRNLFLSFSPFQPLLPARVILFSNCLSNIALLPRHTSLSLIAQPSYRPHPTR